MGRNSRDSREKIKAWVEVNPDGYLEKSINQICEETGLSFPTVDWHLHEIIADHDGCLPSEVLAKRQKAGFVVGSAKSSEIISEIHRLHEGGMDPRDIAYTMEVHPLTVQKYLNQEDNDAKSLE